MLRNYPAGGFHQGRHQAIISYRLYGIGPRRQCIGSIDARKWVRKTGCRWDLQAGWDVQI